MTEPQATVWFDGDCPLCQREITLMRRWDRRGAIEFIDLTLNDGCPADRDAMLKRFHARESGGEMVSGAAAFAVMWRAIPMLRPLGLLARNRVLLWGLERTYRAFLLLRPTLQKWARRGARS